MPVNIAAARRPSQEARFAAKAAAIIKPDAIYSFIDRLHVWDREPLTPRQLAPVERHCGGGLFVFNGPDGFFGGYHQQIQMVQPDFQALRLLARLRPDVYPNKLEPALDWIFPDEALLAEAVDFLDRYHVKPYRRAGHSRRYQHGDGFYTDAPRAPNNFFPYHDQPCRLTGEAHCLHMNWTMLRRAMERAGLFTLDDILKLEFDWFWFWQKRLRFQELDYRELGRLYRVARGRTARQRSRGFDRDLADGVVLADAPVNKNGHRLDGMVQNVVDHWKSKLDITSCLLPPLPAIDLIHLLPRPRMSLL